ncbi:MAG: UDP-N-acetylglucosamine 1-carboxyvinyltransferase [Clostridia bacterium]|nr:UDP-N-acetylglucosamine 1-carboxyvinyltransferase [Clostridia bacterium]
MSKIIIKKSDPLCGSVSCSGSKNAALPILASTILTKGTSTLFNIPALTDIEHMLYILRELGGKCTRFADRVDIDFTECHGYCAPYESVSKFRGSFLLAAPLLARMGRARISMPGGCPIGNRPIDLHLKGFAALGAEVENGHGFVDLSCKKLKGAKIYLDFPSVGATENLIMAAVLAEGETVIENAAAEPEITDLADFLNAQGASISGMGSDTITICGVKELTPASYRIISDRIEAGTFMSAFAITGGSGSILNVNPLHLKPVTAKLSEMGAVITEHESSVSIDASRPLSSANIKTLPFPGFPTDMQAQFSALLCETEGTGIIVETVFENRFLHIGELNRMGANIRIDGRSSVIEGPQKLSGAKVTAFDLRGGASLVLAGLCASGETEISGVEHIERGYEHLCEKISSLGGNIFLD